MSNGIFLYWLPGWEKEKATRGELLATPLASALRDALRSERTFQTLVSVHSVAKGPSGSSGSLVVCHHPAWPDAHRLGYYPEEQTWRDCGGFWLGYATDCKPGPDSLQRSDLVSGYDYELGDEQIWHAPIIRYPAGNPNLPQTMAVDSSGQFVESVTDSMAWAWSLACDIWDRYMMGDGLQRPEMFSIAVNCLSLNYRLGVHECSVLGLIDGPKAQQILKAAIAGPMIEELMGESAKKNRAAEA